MKKLFVLLGILCAFYFVSCGNIQLAGGDMGVVSLAIGDELAREIRSAASLRNAGVGAYTVTASIRGGYSDSQTVAVADDTYSGVTFTFEGVPVGETIVLDLTAKANGNYIWYGNSGKHTVEQGENLLTIALGRVSGVLMWDSSSVKTTPYGNYDFDNATSTGVPKVSPVWCFDKYGNVYVAQDTDVGSGGVRQYKIQSNGSYNPSLLEYNDHAGGNFTSITYDNDKNILYGLEDGGDGLKLRYAPALGQGFRDMSWKPNPDSFKGNQLGVAIHAGNIYSANFEQTEEPSLDGTSWKSVVTISKYNVADGENSSPSSQKTITLNPVFGSTPNFSPSGQMIYHEGALYLLLSAFDITSDSTASAQHSCGAIVKINPQTLAVDTSFGNGGFLGLADGRDVSGNTADGATYNQTLYAPTESNVSRTFCGPAGFVAVMPKKLVIGDGGYTLSNSGTGLLAKRKSRIITVDLETLAFDIVNIDSSDLYGNLGVISGYITPTYD